MQNLTEIYYHVSWNKVNKPRGGFNVFRLAPWRCARAMPLGNEECRVLQETSKTIGKGLLPHWSSHFSADLIWHLTDSRLPSRAHEKSIEPSTGGNLQESTTPCSIHSVSGNSPLIGVGANPFLWNYRWKSLPVFRTSISSSKTIGQASLTTTGRRKATDHPTWSLENM